MKTLTRKDVYPSYRYLYFELIEARHMINLSPPSWGAEDYLFIAGEEPWERKIITIYSTSDEDSPEEDDGYEVLDEDGNPIGD